MRGWYCFVRRLTTRGFERPLGASQHTAGGTYGMVVGHVVPEAAVGGNIALVQEGDPITIDAASAATQRARRRTRAPPQSLASARTALHARRIGQVRQAGVVGKPGRGNGLMPWQPWLGQQKLHWHTIHAFEYRDDSGR